jgi:nucleoside-diphosphate-sugar epimerase
MLCEQNSIDWAWIRPCYVFGKGDVSTRLIPRLVNKFSNNEDIELDECTSVVDYIHIDDFCNILYEILVSNELGVFNICSGKQYEIKEVIEVIRATTNSRSKVTYNRELNRGLPTYVCGENTRSLNVAKIKPNFDLQQGILKTIK